MTAARASTRVAANEVSGRYEHPEPPARTRPPDASTGGGCRQTPRLRGPRAPIVPQNLYEFWVVLTRPTAVNGLGKTAAEAAAELESGHDHRCLVGRDQ